jgi:hypothetical protein
MRRLLPWVLVALIAVGAAAGAALGVAQKTPAETPSQWVAAVLATTQRAGTAGFSYTQVTSSPNADLRSSLSGQGSVDFGTGAAQVSETDHVVSFSSTGHQPLHPVHSTNTPKAMVINGTIYQSDPIPGFRFTALYRVLPAPKLPRAQRGLSLALNAPVALDALRGPNAVASVVDLGPTTIGGTATTQFEVTYAPLHICAPHQPPAVVRQRPSRVWVDNAGRLVQVRSTSYFSDRLPRGVKVPAALNGYPRAPMTTVATLTFSAFGLPVHVVAPPASAIAPAGESSVGFATARADTCPSQ